MIIKSKIFIVLVECKTTKWQLHEITLKFQFDDITDEPLELGMCNVVWE
jgi:hypothetical protein